jgi:hypothetical protein
MREAAAPLSQHVPDLPTGLDEVVARALAKEPDQRFASMPDFAKALERVRTRHLRATSESTELTRPAFVPPDAAVTAPTPAPRAPGRALVAVALAVACALGMIAGVGLDRWSSARRTLAPMHQDELLVLTTTPPGAQVELDGVLLAESTPTAVRGLAPGPHRLRFKKDTVVVERELVTGGERVAMQLVLPPASRSVKIRTVPTGARVYANGKLMAASTPATLELASDDFYELRLEKTGFEPFQANLTPEDTAAEVVYSLELERQPRGELMVESGMPAEVWIDGMFTGYETPTLGLRVASGEHSVELRDPSGKQSRPVNVNVQQGETVRLSLDFDGVGVH